MTKRVELRVYTPLGPKDFVFDGMTKAKLYAESIMYQNYGKSPVTDVKNYRGMFRFTEYTLQ